MVRPNLRGLRFCVVFLLLAATAQAEQRTVVIFHTSDIHGGVAPRKARWNAEDKTRMVGGFAALKKVLDAEKLPYVLLDSGDLFQGTPEGNLTRGDVVIDAMNALGYAASTIGNHDYDYGEANLERLARRAGFPLLGANITRRSDKKRPDYAGDVLMLEIGGVKLGVIGLATHHTPTTTLPKNVTHLEFGDEPAHAKKHALALKAKGAHAIVALSHCGLLPSHARKRVKADELVLTERDRQYKGDLAIARGAPVDLVLGGHMHNGLDKPWRDPESGVYIVGSWENLAAVSRIEITVDTEARRVVGVTGRLIILWVDELGTDPGVAAIVAKHQAGVATRLDETIGECSDNELNRKGQRDSPLGNWLSDVMRKEGGADVAVQNTFGIRDDLFKGPIRLRDMYRVMPFENTLVTVEMPGQTLRQLVLDNLKGARSGLQISGMTVSYVLRKGDVRDVTIQVAGAPLEPKRTYRVATNNYLAGGGSDGDAFTGLEVVDTARPIRELFIAAFRAATPVSSPPTGRFRMIRQGD